MSSGARKRPFSDRLVSWWRGKSASADARTRAIHACVDQPDAALAELQEEQGRIAQELEETFLAYDKKLQSMAKRLAGLEGEPPTVKELDRMREEQLALWRLVRRAQAAGRSTRELEREVREWSEHKESPASVGHPDHPETRMEVIKSELAVRGSFVAERNPKPSFPVFPIKPEFTRDLDAVAQSVRMEEPALESLIPEAVAPEWGYESDEHLVRELSSREREISKLLTVSHDASAAAEIASLARELRELHGHLRQHDRRTQRTRIRWRMGIPRESVSTRHV